MVILAQHANQGKLTGAETSLARWLVYVHTHCDLPLDYRDDGQKGLVVGCVNSNLRPEKARPGRSGDHATYRRSLSDRPCIFRAFHPLLEKLKYAMENGLLHQGRY